jgi:hypothetical protein
MTQEERIIAIIESFFADRKHTEKERAIVTELITSSFVTINEQGNIVPNLDPTELKGEKIAIVGNHSAGLTKSLLSSIVEPQKFAQVDANYWDSLKDEQRKEHESLAKETKMDITMPIIPLEYTMYDTSKSEAKRYGNNKKHKKRRK